MGDEVRALIEYASLGDPAWTRDDMLGIIAELNAALKAAHAEMHARELHHFETEKLLTEAGIDPDAAHAEPDDDRQYIISLLTPYVEIEDFAEALADQMLEAGLRSHGTPATVEQVAEVCGREEVFDANTPTGMARGIMAHFIVLNREPTESATGEGNE